MTRDRPKSTRARVLSTDETVLVLELRVPTTTMATTPARGAAARPMSRSTSSALAMAASISSTVWGPSSTGVSRESALMTARVNRSESVGLSGSAAMRNGSAARGVHSKSGLRSGPGGPPAAAQDQPDGDAEGHGEEHLSLIHISEPTRQAEISYAV